MVCHAAERHSACSDAAAADQAVEAGGAVAVEERMEGGRETGRRRQERRE